MKKLTWRLSKLPTPEEIQVLVNDKIITKEEAREILFREEEVEKDRDLDSYKQEIKFLRELVEKLSSSNRTVVYEYIQAKPLNYSWYQPYVIWCSSSSLPNAYSLTSTGYNYSSGTATTGSTLASYNYSSGTASSTDQFSGISAQGSTDFTNIATF